jgi:hypothetical protein
VNFYIYNIIYYNLEYIGQNINPYFLNNIGNIIVMNFINLVIGLILIVVYEKLIVHNIKYYEEIIENY